jgi:hypothetical protein
MKTKGTPVSKVVKTTKPMLGKQVGTVEDFKSTSGKKLGTLTKTYKSVSVKKS